MKSFLVQINLSKNVNSSYGFVIRSKAWLSQTAGMRRYLKKNSESIIVTSGFYYDVKNDPISDVRTLQFLTVCRLCESSAFAVTKYLVGYEIHLELRCISVFDIQRTVHRDIFL
jgi:hypothetical protein